MTSTLSTSASRSGVVSDSDDTWWLEVKKKHGKVTVKKRRLLPTPKALSLKHDAISTVRYSRTAYEGCGWRITFDRRVRSHGSILVASFEGVLLPAVVVEIKGEPPKRILRALGLPNKTFSKSRWSTAADA